MAQTVLEVPTRMMIPNIQFEDLTEEMTRRWQQQIDIMLPAVDL
jgi:hypothetical protein